METSGEKAVAIVHDFLKSGVELPFSTEVGPQVLALSSASVDEVDLEKFVKLVQVDPGLATKVLRLANSVYFAGLTKIVNLKRAIVQIGLEEAVGFIQVVYYRKTLPKFPEFRGYFADKDFWSHSWACANACKMLGHPAVGTTVLPGELYIAGLLHGVGKLVLALHRPIEFLKSLQNASEFSQPLYQAQLDVLGTTDAEIACELLKAWQMPENVCMAIRYYANPEQAEPEYRDFAALVQYAYFLANTSGIGNMKDEFCFDLETTWAATAEESPFPSQEIRLDLTRQIQASLRKKSGTIAAIGSEPLAGEEEEPQKVVAKRVKPRESGLQLFFSWLGSLFR
jgi:HD-like signal output (HDOD) protein